MRAPEAPNGRFQRTASSKAVSSKPERTGVRHAESRVNGEESTVQETKRVDEEIGRMEGSTDETPRRIHSGKPAE